MCGISGIVNLDPGNPVSAQTLARMSRSLAHRGPNGQGEFLDHNVGLAHRRLSIIDLAGGAQPMYNEDESVVTVFNGEIYNFGDLTARLLARGHRFRTRSDTEAIVHAWEEFGESSVDHFRGMFAIALWDRKARKLFLARDRLGVKPLYYYQGPGIFAFASEIKALLEIPSVPREVDLDALSLYMSLRYVPGPRTMFRNIFKLQPGHTLTLDHRGVTIRRYWDLQYGSSNESEEAQLEALDRVLTESVQLRLIAEVPLGVFLSGGLDSTAILATMSELRQSKNIDTFSVGYRELSGAEAESNEFEFARMAATAFGSNHHECRIGPEDFSNVLPDLVWHLDEPLADPTCVPLYFIARAARERITVVLSGEGADEAFGGYSIYQRMLELENFSRYGRRFFRGMAALARPLLGGERPRLVADSIGVPLEKRYRGVARAFAPDIKRELLPWSASRYADADLSSVFESCFHAAGAVSPLDRMLYVDTHIWLPDDLLLKADKMTMAHALELRVPFLDHRLLEFAATLPAASKRRGGSGKVLLRRLMAKKLPEPIINRTKKGFPVPLESWLRGPLHDWTRDTLLGAGSAVGSYMDTAVVRRIVDEHRQGVMKRDRELWTLLVFELWHRKFMGRTTPETYQAEKPAQAGTR
jgi:asparagine synthase (glutamine-hydrolysing)